MDLLIWNNTSTLYLLRTISLYTHGPTRFNIYFFVYGYNGLGPSDCIQIQVTQNVDYL